MFWVGWFHVGSVGWRQTNNFLRMALLIKKCTSPSKVLIFCLFLLTLGVMTLYSLRIHVTRLCYNYWFWKYFKQVLPSTQTICGGYKDVYVKSFSVPKARLWNSLPSEWFALTSDLYTFKSRINRCLLSLS